MNKPSDTAFSYIALGSLIALTAFVIETKSFLVLLGGVAAVFTAIYLLARK